MENKTEEPKALEIVNPVTGEIVEGKTPDQLLLNAKEAAQALEKVIMSNDRPPVMFNGKRHLEYPHWQTLGAFYHASVRTLDAEVVEIGGVRGFKAKALVIDENTGLIIGGAEAYCMQDERNWSGKPLFQLASMAQTRAGSKALSNKYRYVAIVAGFEPTPSEEMPDEMRGQKQVSMPRSKAVPVVASSGEPVASPAEVSTPGVEDAPKEPSKFFTLLHKVAREKNVPAEKLKWIIKETYKKESSKDLLDSECTALIKLIEAGAVR